MRNLSLLLLIIISSCGKKYYDPRTPLPETLRGAINSSFRSPENVSRDKYQHPEKTLDFFEIRPEMSVVEVNPGSGYFTEILGPYLSHKGELYLAVPRMPPNPPPVLIENEKKLQDILSRNAEVQGRTKLVPLEPIDKKNRLKKDYADVVLVFNSVHNWVAQDMTDVAFGFFHDVLKDGGTLGIVQHRVRKGKPKVPKSGYMYEEEVIRLAEMNGFKFIGKSQVNSNPRDKANYPDGVWTLPPTFRLGNKNRDKFEKIGESDRMTLKFERVSLQRKLTSRQIR